MTPQQRSEILRAIQNLQLEDYVNLDLESDHPLDQLNVDMVVTTSQRIHLYANIQPLVSDRAKNFNEALNADHVSIKAILDIVRAVYFRPVAADEFKQ